MKKLKKITVLLLALILVSAMTSCTKKQEEQHIHKIGVVVYDLKDEQVQAYIEDMKLQLESVDNSEDIQDVIDQFDSEDDYWAYEFTVYQKQLPIQNYVSALNDEYNEKAVDSSSEEAQEEWDTYFENLKDKLVKEQNFQNQ